MKMRIMIMKVMILMIKTNLNNDNEKDNFANNKKKEIIRN